MRLFPVVKKKDNQSLRATFLFTTLPFLFLSLPAFAFPARCVGASDGDTITVLTTDHQQIKIRLYGIDCPESSQAHGKKAKQAMSALVFGKSVEVKPITKDRYGRTVARVSVNGLDVCKEQVRMGYAWVFQKYCKTPACKEWQRLETEARIAKRGLWMDKDPVPPWDWRKARRKKK